MDIGEKIKNRREELGITQDELAKRVGYRSRSSINKIETEGRSIPRSKINLFSEALKLQPSYLLGLNDGEQALVNFFDLIDFLKTLDCYIYPCALGDCTVRKGQIADENIMYVQPNIKHEYHAKIVGCNDMLCTECPKFMKSYKIIYKDKSAIISFQDYQKAKDEILSFIRFKINELIK